MVGDLESKANKSKVFSLERLYKIFVNKKILVWKNFGPKGNFVTEKILGPKKFVDRKKCWVPKNVGFQKKISAQIFFLLDTTYVSRHK